MGPEACVGVCIGHIRENGKATVRSFFALVSWGPLMAQFPNQCSKLAELGDCLINRAVGEERSGCFYAQTVPELLLVGWREEAGPGFRAPAQGATALGKQRAGLQRVFLPIALHMSELRVCVCVSVGGGR